MSLIEHNEIQCPRCNGNGATMGLPGDVDLCPVCEGDGQVVRATNYRKAIEERDALRAAVRAYLTGAPLDEHGRFKDPAREVLYRAAGGQ